MQVSKAVKVIVLVCALAFAVFAATNNGKPKQETKRQNQAASCCRKDKAGQKAAHAHEGTAQKAESCDLKAAHSAKKDGTGCGGDCCQAGKSAAHAEKKSADSCCGGGSCCDGGACCGGDSCQSKHGAATAQSGDKEAKAGDCGCACCAGGACSMKKNS